MKILITMIAAISILSGCIVAPPDRGYRNDGYHHDRDRDGVPNRVDRDRDGDGVPNSQDRRPDNPRRY